MQNYKINFLNGSQICPKLIHSKDTFMKFLDLVNLKTAGWRLVALLPKQQEFMTKYNNGNGSLPNFVQYKFI